MAAEEAREYVSVSPKVVLERLRVVWKITRSNVLLGCSNHTKILINDLYTHILISNTFNKAKFFGIRRGKGKCVGSTKSNMGQVFQQDYKSDVLLVCSDQYIISWITYLAWRIHSSGNF